MEALRRRTGARERLVVALDELGGVAELARRARDQRAVRLHDREVAIRRRVLADVLDRQLEADVEIERAAEVADADAVMAIVPVRFAEEVQRVAERSEEHTSELQSLRHLVCRLLL